MSNETPKKIWLDSDGAAWEHYSEEDTPYIRADLVDGLVEALKICLAGNGYEFDDRPAEAALKALEETDGN